MLAFQILPPLGSRRPMQNRDRVRVNWTPIVRGMVAVLWLPLFGDRVGADDAEALGRQVQQILRAKCVACHHEGEAEGGLNLESAESIAAGSDSGGLIVAGNHQESLLFRRVSGDEPPIMPPEDNGVGAQPVTEAEQALLARWIDEGAELPAGAGSSKLDWQPVPETLQPCYSVAVSHAQPLVAFGQGPEAMFRYLDESGQTLLEQTLATEDETNATDLVTSLAIAVDGQAIAVGRFRRVDLFRHVGTPRSVEGRTTVAAAAEAVGSLPAQVLAGAWLPPHAVLPLRPAVTVADGPAAPALLVYQGLRPSALVAGQQVAALQDFPLQHRLERAVRRAEVRHQRQQQRVSRATTGKQQATDQIAAFEAGVKKAMEALAAAKKDVEKKEKAEEKEAAMQVVANRQQALAAAEASLQTARRAVQQAGAVVQAETANAAATEQAVAAARQTLAEDNAHVIAAALSADGRWVAIQVASDRVEVFHVRSQRWYASLTGMPSEPTSERPLRMRGLAADAAGGWCAMAANGQTLRWETLGSWQHAWRWDDRAAAEELPDRVDALAFSPDGTRLAVASGEPSRRGCLAIVDATSGQRVQQWPRLHSDSVMAVAFSPDARYVASAAADKLVRVITLQEAAAGSADEPPILDLEGHAHHVLALAWHPDGVRIASGSADRSVRIWDLNAKKLVRTIGGFASAVTGLDVDRDGQHFVASAGGRQLRVVRFDNGQVLRDCASVSQHIYAVAVQPEDAWVAAAQHRGGIRFWRLGDGKPLQ